MERRRIGMGEAIVDLILLSLLVLFFGLEQRRRPELYFRFWLAGWWLVMIGVLCRTFQVENAVAAVLQHCVRQDAFACGGMAFVFSFLASKRRLRAVLQAAIGISALMCVVLDLIIVQRASNGWLYGLILLGEAASILTAHRFLKTGQTWFFPLMTGVCVSFGLVMGCALSLGKTGDLINLIMAQTFVSAGLLFARSGHKGGRLVGSVAFVAWGAYYVVTADLFGMPWMTEALKGARLIPKYLVGAGMVLTIFEEAQAELAMLGAEQRRLHEDYRFLFTSNPQPMWIYDAETTLVLAVNDAAVGAYGYAEAAFVGMRAGALEVPGEVPRHRRADGTLLDVEVTERDTRFGGQDARFVLAVDVTEREVLHRELVRQAQHDVLTGLPNRSVLDDRIEQCMVRCIREDKKGAVLTVDVDHFKAVNDTYGHLLGDECLKAVALRLSSRVRQVDTIARTGGEEFTIVVGGLADRAAADKVCAVMLGLFEKPLVCGEQELAVTVSIGVALFPDHAIDTEGLRRRSDQALYEAKRRGRNRAVFASTVAV